MDWIASWLPWAVGLGGAGLGAAWFFGLMPVIGAAAQIAAAALAPIVGALVQGIVYTWQSIVFPGLLDILDSWATILTVLGMGAFLWFGLAARYEVRELHTIRALSQCQAQLRAQRKPVPKTPEPQLELPWPFKW